MRAREDLTIVQFPMLNSVTKIKFRQVENLAKMLILIQLGDRPNKKPAQRLPTRVLGSWSRHFSSLRMDVLHWNLIRPYFAGITCRDILAQNKELCRIASASTKMGRTQGRFSFRMTIENWE